VALLLACDLLFCHNGLSIMRGQGHNGWAAAARLILCGCLLLSRPALASPAADALQRAVALVQEGRLEEAAKAAESVLADPATRPIACSVLGTIRIRQQRYDEAVPLLQEAIRLEPRLVGAHLSLAELYTLWRDTEHAVPLYRRVVELDAGNVPARVALAQVEIERERHEQALKLAEPVMDAFKASPEGLLVLASALPRTGNREALPALALDWLRLANVPQEWSLAFATRLAAGGAADEALAVLDRVREQGTPSYELAFNLAGVHLMRGDPVRALAAYDAAISLQPDSIAALRQAGALAERQGELERSLSYWIRAKKIAPDDPEVLLAFGRVCLKMDLLDDAEPALSKAAELRPDEVSYQYALAATKVGKGQYDEARRIIERLVQKHPGDAVLQYALGAVLYTQGHVTEAETRLRESLRLKPDQLASRYYLALVARDQGRDAEAITMLQELLHSHPDHAPAHETLGALLITAKRYEEAESSLRTAIRLDPRSARAHYQLGLVLSRLGMKDEADRQLAHAKTLREGDEASSRLQVRLLDPEQ
jgi:tetratricopeptide (TPR) repeat protein